MYSLNKVTWCMINPAMIAVLILCAALVWRKRWMIGAAIGWIYLWGCPALSRIIGGALERPYSADAMAKVETYPSADAIADLGGGVGYASNVCVYAQLNSSADRVVHSARLWKAGKAPIVIPSGAGCGDSDAEILRELGVPQEAIVVENEARNTEENAKRIAEVIRVALEALPREPPRDTATPSFGLSSVPRILVVTSAWHMRRSMLMFEKYAPEVEAIPAPCDFECGGKNWGWDELLPNFEAAGANARYLHEWVGIIGYKYLRR